MSRNAPGHETEIEDRQFRELLSSNPRPAVIWLGVLLVLLALEAGRVFAGIGQVLGVVGFLFGMVSSIPGYVGGNFASATPVAQFAVETGVTWLTAVVILFAILSPFGEVVPDGVVNALGSEFSRRQRRWAKRGVLTAAASGLAAVAFLSPLSATVAAAVGGFLGWYRLARVVTARR